MIHFYCILRTTCNKERNRRSHHSFWLLFFHSQATGLSNEHKKKEHHSDGNATPYFVPSLIWPVAIVQAWIIERVFVQNNQTKRLVSKNIGVYVMQYREKHCTVHSSWRCPKHTQRLAGHTEKRIISRWKLSGSSNSLPIMRIWWNTGPQMWDYPKRQTIEQKTAYKISPSDPLWCYKNVQKGFFFSLNFWHTTF